MKKFFLITSSSFVLFYNIFFSNLYSQINNSIVVKVGDSLVTNIDIQNEIITNLVINGQEINQININKNKNFAVKNIINKSIKNDEIKKYEIKDYSKIELQDYIESVAKNLNTDQNGLKEIFKKFEIDYQTFVNRHETELLWNTLIFRLYKNQTNINIIDVENEIEKIKDNKSEEELKKIKKNILNQKKQEKLNLFSRSHFSNLENTVVINFQ
jgi:hypothetical protein